VNQSIFDSSGNIPYFLISNTDGKVWYIPDINSRLALQLYQPSSRKGKLLKSCFPVLKRFLFFRHLLGITVQKFAVQSSLSELLCNLFHIENVEVSLFCGTPSVHQKLTMQVSDGSSILGYCKISDKKGVKALFQHEETILRVLADKGIQGVPQCLYNGVLKDETHIFVQTTAKTKASKGLHELSTIHWNFLNQLHLKTNIRLPFEESDFYQTLQSLRKNLTHLSAFDTSTVTSAIVQAEEFYKGKQVKFSIHHSDFTPWNMFVEKGNLFVFDWEYSKRTFPPFLDSFHFFTQVCFFAQNKNAEEIMAAYHAKRGLFAEHFDNPDFSYLCYLTGIMAFYVNRDKNTFSKETADNIRIWTGLLRLLQKQI
jgi:hypothetical protein